MSILVTCLTHWCGPDVRGLTPAAYSHRWRTPTPAGRISRRTPSYRSIAFQRRAKGGHRLHHHIASFSHGDAFDGRSQNVVRNYLRMRATRSTKLNRYVNFFQFSAKLYVYSKWSFHANLYFCENLYFYAKLSFSVPTFNLLYVNSFQRV